MIEKDIPHNLTTKLFTISTLLAQRLMADSLAEIFWMPHKKHISVIKVCPGAYIIYIKVQAEWDFPAIPTVEKDYSFPR